MQSTRCRRRSSQGRRPESRAGARVPEHFGLVPICLMSMATEPIMRLMDSPASGSCSACLRWREGRRRWGRWAGCWSWEAPFSVQFSERAKNPRAACSVVWSGMNLFSRWLRYYRLLLYFPHNCNCICEREQNYFQFYHPPFDFGTHRDALDTCDLSNIWSKWWENMTWPTKRQRQRKYKVNDNDNDKYI